EDGIRDFHVTGVQTCALPICFDPFGVVAGVPPREDLVPHQAYAAERAVQHRRLLLGGVDPHLVRRTHVRILPFLCLIGKRKEKVLSASRFGLSRLRRATPSGGRIPPRPEGRGLLRRAW